MEKKKLPEKTKKVGRPVREDKSYQLAICLEIALGQSNKQIKKMLKEKYNIEMNDSVFSHIYRKLPRWKKLTRYLRNRILDRISDIPIADKRVRLLRFEKAYHKALEPSLKSIVFNKKNGKKIKIMEIKIGAAIQALVEARKEVEGEKPINIDNSININQETRLVFADIKPHELTAGELIKKLNYALTEQHHVKED